jgi:hypothetical protein
MTWHLWRILQNPPRQHPLFWRTLQQPSNLLTPMGNLLVRILLIIGGLSLVVLSPPLALVLLIYGVVLLPLSVLMFSGIGYGIYGALTIATHLAQEHRHGRYELLQLTPAGAILIDVVVSAGCLHRRNRFQQVHKLVRFTAYSLLIALSLVAGFIWLSLTYNPSGSSNNEAVVQQVFPIILFLLGACAAFYIDHIQTIITGCLVGMLTPYYTQSALEVRVMLVVLFAAVQMGVYGLSLAIVLIVSPVIQHSIVDMPLAYVLTMMSAIGIFYTVRESVIRVLWRFLLRQSYTSAAEWRAALC